jgi:DNA-binding transcriptional regulator YiaG
MPELTPKQQEHLEALRDIKRRHNLTVSKLAESVPMGKPKRTVEDWLSGRSRVDPLALWSLLYTLDGVDIREEEETPDV